MNISIFLARIFGLYLAIISIAMLIDWKGFLRRIERYVENPGLMLFGSIMTLLLGLLLINIHNVWVWDWRVVITLLCWITFIKGLVHLFIPTFPAKVISIYKTGIVYYSCGIVTLIIGGFLIYQGFFVG